MTKNDFRRPRFPKYIEWPEHLARLLGKLPDKVVAKRAGVNPATVRNERRRRGIETCHPKPKVTEWTDEMIALLGTDTDVIIAELLGITAERVGYKRRNLGIPPYASTPKPPNPFWTPKRIALLGTASDSQVARRLKITQKMVAYRRQLLGIAPFEPATRGVRWTKAMLRWLGKEPDMAVAERLGIGRTAVIAERRRRQIPPNRAPGLPVRRDRRTIAVLKRPSHEAAAVLGVKHQTVSRLRQDLGVPLPERPTVWTPKVLRQLGKVPDAVLAAQIGRAPRP
ncbi:MAG: hypothetical protein HC897_18065 [Thermoanaerobaculia bacterium]|nr:hypothetical protein [Thermoanaerobaculia bacterium]